MAIIFVICEQFTEFPILSFRFLALLIFWKKWTILLFEIDNEICFRAGRNSPLAVKGESHESANPSVGPSRLDPGTNGIVRMKETSFFNLLTAPEFFRGLLLPDRFQREKTEESKMNETSRQKVFNTKSIAVMGMMSAIAFVAKLISTIFPMVAGFLSFDLKDVVIVIAGFIGGPVMAAAITVIVSLIEMVSISTTGIIGFIMNVIQSCSFACVASAFYQRNRKMKGAVIGLIAGVITAAAVMILWNWLITPLYMGVPRDVVVKMLIPTFLPFNLVKGGINATLAMLLYKPVVNTLRKANLVEPSSSSAGQKKIGVVIASLVLFVSFVLLGLVLAGVI